jgi:hypothetical protein
MPDGDGLEKRVRSLENKVWLAIGAAAVFAVWLGVTNAYTIPKAALDAMSGSAAKQAGDQIQVLLNQAQADAKAIGSLASEKKLTLGGTCFEPRVLYRCGTMGDHITWVDNKDECDRIGWNLDGHLNILAQCKGN